MDICQQVEGVASRRRIALGGDAGREERGSFYYDETAILVLIRPGHKGKGIEMVETGRRGGGDSS